MYHINNPAPSSGWNYGDFPPFENTDNLSNSPNLKKKKKIEITLKKP